MFVYVGNSAFEGGPEGGVPDDGVSVYDFDPSTGEATHIQTVNGLRSSTYLARHPKLPVLYVLERWVNAGRAMPTPEQQKGDRVAAFAIDKQRGTLTLIGRGSTGGHSPMHINIHPSGRYAFFANPGLPEDSDPMSCSSTVVRLGADGALGEVCASVRDEGVVPLWRHRRKSYPHSVFADPDWKRVFICNLMTDRVMIYRFDEASGALTPGEQPYAQVNSGAGPRHLAFHQNGRFFYVINEFDATVAAFEYDKEKGTASIVQTISIQPADFDGKKSGAHILVGPTGAFLYCSNRSDRSIVIFSIDRKSGELSLVGHRKTLGDRPRDFIFDPTGRAFLVANQHKGGVTSFFVDQASGDLRPTGKTIDMKYPNCVLFAPA